MYEKTLTIKKMMDNIFEKKNFMLKKKKKVEPFKTFPNILEFLRRKTFGIIQITKLIISFKKYSHL